MDYTSNDLTLKEVESFICYPSKTLTNALKKKFNTVYSERDKLNKRELNFLIESFSFDKDFKKRIFSGYARSLTHRANKINVELTEIARIEFLSYIFSNQIFVDFLKPQLIECNIKKEMIDIQLKINYHYKAGDDDYGYVGFETKIDDYEFSDVIYNGSAYSNIPSKITSEYKENEQKYINDKTELILKNIKAYTFLDIRKEIFELFENSLNQYFNLDYSKIDTEIERLKTKIINEDFLKINVLLFDDELNNDYLNFFKMNLLYRKKTILK